MKFKIETINFEDFIDYFKELSLDPRYLNKFGRSFFEIKIKNNIEYQDDARKDIPVGNAYIEFRNKNREVLGAVDTHFNQNNEITIKCCHPLTIFEKSLDENRDHLRMHDIRDVLKMFIQDRLTQIANNEGTPRIELLAQSISLVFKNSENRMGYLPNYNLKLMNNVRFIPYNDMMVNNRIIKSYGYDFNDNPKGTLSDCLNEKESISEKTYNKLMTFCDSLGGLILDVASEEKGMYGNFVVMNPELQKLRRPLLQVPQNSYEDIGHFYDTENPLEIRTIWPNLEKIAARIKGQITSDTYPSYNSTTKVLDENNQMIFDRQTVYSAINSRSIGQNLKTEMNLIVAYVNSEEKAEEITIDNFDDLDKNDVSELIHMIDCHLPISKEIGDHLVQFKRTYKGNISREHFSSEFIQILNEIEDKKERGENSSVEISNDMTIGYQVECSNCSSIMFPVKENETKEGVTYLEKRPPSRNQGLWECQICGELEATKGKEVNLKDNYLETQKVLIHDVIINDLEYNLIINLEVVAPIKCARMVSSDGLKGFSVPMGQDFIGEINGQFYNPETKQHEMISGLKVDMLIPYGSMKAKENGIALSQIRLSNALNNNKISINEEYKNNNQEKITEIIANTPKVQLTRRKFNPETKSFIESTEEVHIGMINVKVTEVGSEYSKLKTETNDMKISYMNILSYNWLGLDSLNSAMLSASSSNSIEEQEVIIDLLKTYYSDISNKNQLSPDNFDNKEGRTTIKAWMTKGEWLKTLGFHPLFTAEVFKDGGYYMLDGSIPIVFPSRKNMLKLVTVMSGNRVRLPPVISYLMLLYLDIYIYTKGLPEDKRREAKRKIQNKIEYIKEHIFELLTGKRGLFTRATNFVGEGIGGKIIGTGYIPTGVAVIGDSRFWRKVRSKIEALGLSYDKLMTGEESIYGQYERAPVVWCGQPLNSTKIWHPRRANKYFKEKYGVNFYEMYPDFKGFMRNTLDMVMLQQEDSDGDYGRCLIPYTISAQRELANLNKKMENYNIFHNTEEYPLITQLYSQTKKWYLEYLIKEINGSREKIPDRISLILYYCSFENKNKVILKSYKKKGDIGIITASQWKIQEILNFLVSTTGTANPIKLKVKGIKSLVSISERDRVILGSAYQTILTQNGCVRGLKGVKDLTEGALGPIAMDKKITWIDDREEYREGTVREMVSEEFRNGGYKEDDINKFFAVCDFWKDIAALKVNKNGMIFSDNDKMTITAKMINAYTALAHGSKYSAKDKMNMFSRLRAKGADYLFSSHISYKVMFYLDKIKHLF